MLRDEAKTGMELARELEERRGQRPSPGTIYPVLKVMTERGLLSVDGEKRYSLTEDGKKELDGSLDHFFSMFFDIDEMREACRCGDMQGGHRHHEDDCPCHKCNPD